MNDSLTSNYASLCKTGTLCQQLTGAAPVAGVLVSVQSGGWGGVGGGGVGCCDLGVKPGYKKRVSTGPVICV